MSFSIGTGASAVTLGGPSLLLIAGPCVIESHDHALKLAREIAAQLGIPLGTVKSRMRLAFQRFRRALGEPEL